MLPEYKVAQKINRIAAALIETDSMTGSLPLTREAVRQVTGAPLRDTISPSSQMSNHGSSYMWLVSVVVVLVMVLSVAIYFYGPSTWSWVKIRLGKISPLVKK